MRCGVAEELGSRQTLEDANLAIDDLGALPDGQTPCAFYAVRCSALDCVAAWQCNEE